MLRSKLSRRVVHAGLLAGFWAALTTAGTANAAPGPGLGNLDCGDNEYFKPFTFIENDNPKGANAAVMVRGYFMTIFAPDSGNPPGEIAVYDLSNPKSPVQVKLIDSEPTKIIRESHSLPIALIDGKQYIAIQTTVGMQFWDFTDPVNAQLVGAITLPGVAGGDYENVAWQSSWQGRYLYVAGGNQGIYVIDAADPTKPQLLEKISTSQTGGFRVGPLFAVGDYLVISNMDQKGAYAVLDISVPEAPVLLSKVDKLPRIYSIIVGGNDRIYAAGRDGDFLTHSFTDPTNISLVKNAAIGQDQLYAAAQDHYVFLGRQNNFVKVDVTDEQNPKVVGEGTLGRANPDHGQVTPMGNLIFIGNDHGTGSALFCHQRGKDVTPPVVQTVYPRDGSTGVLPESRVTMVFSDFIDMDTIEGGNVVIRRAGGEPVSGIFTYAFNTLSFGPDEPFEADTTYEIFLPEGGVRDVMGNALPEETLFRFSTGDSIVVPPPPPPPPADSTGGMPGTSTGGLSGSTGGESGLDGGGGSGNASTTSGSGGGGCTFGAVGGGTSRALALLILALGGLVARRRSA